MGEVQKVPQKNVWAIPAFPVAEKIKGWAKSCGISIQNVFESSIRRKKNNPRTAVEAALGNEDKFLNFQRASNSMNIEILKRLQREAFSDLMKLRDRQDKVERALMLLKSNKGVSFEESDTHIKGKVSVSGSLLLTNDDFEKDCDNLRRAGVRNGVRARFTFDTIVRKKDALITEFVAELPEVNVSQQDACTSPLSLRKIMYLASITDWLSLVAIPFGAQCEDIGTFSRPIRGFTHSSASAPPIFSLHHKYATGIVMKKSNIAVSLAELGDASGLDQAPMGCHNSLAQLFCQISGGSKFGLSFLHRRQSMLPHRIRLSPLGTKPHMPLITAAGNTEPTGVPLQSITLAAESELDESLKINGWIEMQRSQGTSLQWSVSLSDCPEDEMGWNISVGQMTSDRFNFSGANSQEKSTAQFQLEAFLNFGIGKRFTLQPGFAYLSDGKDACPTLLFRSNWSF